LNIENHKKLDSLVDEFNLYWREYQDTWDEDLWYVKILIYIQIRLGINMKVLESIKIMRNRTK